MPTPVFPTAYQVEVRGSLFGQLVENVWHVQGPDPFDATVAADVASTFQADYVGIMGALSQDYSISQIFVHNLAGTASGEFTLTISPPQTGGSTNPALPGNVAFCISLRTALAGRSTRGRKYFAGISEVSVTGNVLDQGDIDAILAGVATLRDDLETNLTPMSIFSPTNLTLVPVVSVVSVDNIVDSQRRRLTGRGR